MSKRSLYRGGILCQQIPGVLHKKSRDQIKSSQREEARKGPILAFYNGKISENTQTLGYPQVHFRKLLSFLPVKERKRR